MSGATEETVEKVKESGIGAEGIMSSFLSTWKLEHCKQQYSCSMLLDN